MATSQDILEALADYQVQCNENKRLRKMQRDWSKLLHFVAEDTGDQVHHGCGERRNYFL